MPDFLSTMPLNIGPIASQGNPSAPAMPSFDDFLKNYTNSIQNSDTFKKAYSSLTPTAPGVLDPGYQKTLDQIRSNANYYGGQASSAAQSLAAKRGLAGSSIEQFGVQAGINNTNRTAADQEASVYQQNLQRQQQMQDAQANALFGITGTGGTLASDEIASQRNMAYQQQMLQLQQQLGQQGIDVARQNIDASKSISQQNGLYNLFGALGPSVLSKIFPGSAAGGFGGYGGAAGALPGFAGALGGGGFAPYSVGGAVGPYASVAPAAGGLPGLVAGAGPGLTLAGAGVGASLLASQGEKIAGAPGAFLANPIGAQINIAKNALSSGGNAVSNAAKSVSNAVSSVFRF